MVNPSFVLLTHNCLVCLKTIKIIHGILYAAIKKVNRFWLFSYFFDFNSWFLVKNIDLPKLVFFFLYLKLTPFQ